MARVANKSVEQGRQQVARERLHGLRRHALMAVVRQLPLNRLEELQAELPNNLLEELRPLASFERGRAGQGKYLVTNVQQEVNVKGREHKQLDWDKWVNLLNRFEVGDFMNLKVERETRNGKRQFKIRHEDGRNNTFDLDEIQENEEVYLEEGKLVKVNMDDYVLDGEKFHTLKFENIVDMRKAGEVIWTTKVEESQVSQPEMRVVTTRVIKATKN